MKTAVRKFFGFSFPILARILLGGVFMASGLIKLLEPAANFRAVLYGYDALPAAWVPMIALVVPWLEWILGFFVVSGYALRASSFLLGCFAFSLAAVIALSGKLGLDASQTCGCFGESGPQLTYPQIFFLDIVNGCLGLFLSRFRSSPLTLDRWLSCSAE
ncbi:MAG: DoxX family membrane protein [Candidatus Omnitrophica bacterium]|nr:DoxX family membrane protein [Candidatus Omnitrophota bacterium]